jgi:isocitrate dehydrogenase kinase/phosphatase
MAAKPDGFNKILLDSIDGALLSLGESAKQSIYFHIEHNYKVTRNQIPQNLEQFQRALEKIFGVGSQYLEILIMKNLYAGIGCPLHMETTKQLEFIEYIDMARQNFLNSSCVRQ